MEPGGYAAIGQPGDLRPSDGSSCWSWGTDSWGVAIVRIDCYGYLLPSSFYASICIHWLSRLLLPRTILLITSDYI